MKVFGIDVRCFAAACILVFAGNAAFAEDVPEISPAELNDMINVVRKPDGYVNPNIHKSFWAHVDHVIARDGLDRADYERKLAELVDVNLAYYRAGLVSAILSYEENKPVITPELDALDPVLRASTNPYHALLVKEVDSMLGNPPAPAYAPQNLNAILLNVDLAYYRLKRLLLRQWQSGESETQLAKSRIRMLSAQPMKEARTLLNDGETLTADRIRDDVDDSVITIVFKGSGVNLEERSLIACKTFMESMNMRCNPSSMPFRGRVGIVSADQTDTLAVSMLILQRPELNALTVLQTVSDGDMASSYYGLLEMMATLRFED